MDINEEWDGDVLANIGVGFLQVQGEKTVTFSDQGSDEGWVVQGRRGTNPSKSRPPAKTPDPASDAPVAAEKPAWIVESCLRNKRQGYQRVSQKLPKNAASTRVQVCEPRSVSQTNCVKSTHPRGITMRAQDAWRNSIQRKLKAFRSHGFEDNERYRQNQNMPTQQINY